MTRKERNINRLSKELVKARKRVARYEKGLSKNEHTKIDAMETVRSQLEQFERLGYFNKKGELRKNLAKSKLTYVESFTKGFLINKKSEYHRYKTVKSRTQTIPHIIRNLAKEWDMPEDEVKKFINASTRLQNIGLFELLGLDSEQIKNLLEEHGDVSLDTLEKVALYLIKDKERNVPQIMSEFVGEDDYYLALQEILNRVSNLDEKLRYNSIEQVLYNEDIADKIRSDRYKDYTKEVFGE